MGRGQEKVEVNTLPGFIRQRLNAIERLDLKPRGMHVIHWDMERLSLHKQSERVLEGMKLPAYQLHNSIIT